MITIGKPPQILLQKTFDNKWYLQDSKTWATSQVFKTADHARESLKNGKIKWRKPK